MQWNIKFLKIPLPNKALQYLQSYAFCLFKIAPKAKNQDH